MTQLPTDCLNEIFKYLNEVDLRSCLLVDRLWCEVAVPILWTSIQNYRTLIACLPNESKEILLKNEIFLLTSTSKPLFNYVTFVKGLSTFDIDRKIRRILKNHQPISSAERFDDKKFILVIQEIFKMFMNQTCLKALDYHYPSSISDVSFTCPEAMDCLRNLSELNC